MRRANCFTLGLSCWLGLAACVSEPQALRLVTGSIPATQEIAALLIATTREHDAPIQLELLPRVAGAEAALDALENGAADLAVIENSASYQRPSIRTVAPLYPSVLHIGMRSDRSARTFRELLHGSRVFAGAMDSPARRLVTLLVSLYEASGIEFSFVDDASSDPDVVFVFAPISPARAPLLDGYALFSMGRAEDLGAGTLAETVSLVAPLLRPYVIPSGTYGDVTPSATVTVAMDTLLVAHRDAPSVLVYDLLQSLQTIGPALTAQRPDLIVNRLDDFETSSLAFPIHAGTGAFLARNEPGFYERAAGVLQAVAAGFTALLTGMFGFVRYLRARRKSRIDRIYGEVLAIRRRLAAGLEPDACRHSMEEVRQIRDDAFERLIDEKLQANEAFRILQILISDVLYELESAERRAENGQPLVVTRP